MRYEAILAVIARDRSPHREQYGNVMMPPRYVSGMMASYGLDPNLNTAVNEQKRATTR